MVTVDLFSIVLDPRSPNYYDANSEVTGFVHIVTNEAKSEPKSDYKAITVSLKGHTIVRSSVETSGRVRRKIHVRENIFTKTVILWNKESAGSELVKGTLNKLRFSLRFDNASTGSLTGGGPLPSSFRDFTYGSIIYEVEAVIIKAAKSSLRLHKRCAIELPFRAIKDLNIIDGILEPKIQQVQKTLCCLCCASGPISLTARIPRTGFCIGTDGIPLEVDIENGSNREISYIVATLSKQIVYTAHNRDPPYRNVNDEFVQHAFINTTIQPGESSSLKPPPLPLISDNTIMPTINTCRSIELNYFLIVEAEIHGAVNPSVKFNLVLGNVPLRSH